MTLKTVVADSSLWAQAHLIFAFSHLKHLPYACPLLASESATLPWLLTSAQKINHPLPPLHPCPLATCNQWGTRSKRTMFQAPVLQWRRHSACFSEEPVESSREASLPTLPWRTCNIFSHSPSTPTPISWDYLQNYLHPSLCVRLCHWGTIDKTKSLFYFHQILLGEI